MGTKNSVQKFAYMLIVFQFCHGCPSSCTCDLTNQQVTCNSQTYISIPQGIPVDTVYLYLNNLQKLSITQDDFKAFVNLETLIITGGNITRLESNGFQSLTKLKNLHIDNLKEITAMTFYGLSNLNGLHLNSNQLEHIDSAEINYLQNLQQLNLQGNRLRYIPQNLQLPWLTYIDLSNNIIENITAGKSCDENPFQHLKRLTYIQLYNNKLKAVNLSLFNEFYDLQDLRLDSNLIEIVTGQLNTLKFLNLRKIYLRNNRLQSIPMTLREITARTIINPCHNVLWSRYWIVDFSGNPLHCNCKMTWYKQLIDTVGDPRQVQRCHRYLGSCKTPFITSNLISVPISNFTCTSPTISQAYSTKGNNINSPDTTSLICTGQGDPAPDVTWTTPHGNNYTFSPSRDKAVLNNTGIYNIISAKPEDSGNYVCTVSNVQGQSKGSVQLNVHAIFTPSTERAQGKTRISNGGIDIITDYYTETRPNVTNTKISQTSTVVDTIVNTNVSKAELLETRPSTYITTMTTIIFCILFIVCIGIILLFIYQYKRRGYIGLKCQQKNGESKDSVVVIYNNNTGTDNSSFEADNNVNQNDAIFLESINYEDVSNDRRHYDHQHVHRNLHQNDKYENISKNTNQAKQFPSENSNSANTNGQNCIYDSVGERTIALADTYNGVQTLQEGNDCTYARDTQCTEDMSDETYEHLQNDIYQNVHKNDVQHQQTYAKLKQK